MLIPGFAAQPPHLLADAADFDRIKGLAAREPWAAQAVRGIVEAADTWESNYQSQFGVKQWAAPPAVGYDQYACPVHGNRLTYQPPMAHICPVDKRRWSGWPFDNYIYQLQHFASAKGAIDHALAYRLSGNEEYARTTARILTAYSKLYLELPVYDDKHVLDGYDGARIMSQLLKEAMWLTDMAWAYDLVADSGALTGAEQAAIEQDLLRASAVLISKTDWGKSNHQTWHNAAMAAVGFLTRDFALIWQAIDGPSGFRFQMKNCVLEDGTWYEPSWNYHFVALEASLRLTMTAARNGVDLYAEDGLRRMFDAPLRFAAPDLTLPAIGDSNLFSLYTKDYLYEDGYSRYGDPSYAAVLRGRSRGREALLWGVETVPPAAGPVRSSSAMPQAGAITLRTPYSDHFLALRFGGYGPHAHLDQLSLVSYANGAYMGLDPGIYSYDSPQYETWHKTTLAHNTVLVDQAAQLKAEGGELTMFAALPGLSIARATAGPVSNAASLERTVIFTPEYAIDSFAANGNDGKTHVLDWIFHYKEGQVTTSLDPVPAASPAGKEGYQHLSSVRQAETANSWQADFQRELPARYNSIFASLPSVSGTYEYSQEQAVSGQWCGKLTYNFSEGLGYTVYNGLSLSSPLLKVPFELPEKLSLMVYGDGSGNELIVRVYDSASEHFHLFAGPIDWTGWRRIEAEGISRWNSGAGDGIFDLPTLTISPQILSARGKVRSGAIYVDDLCLTFPSGETCVEDYERTPSRLRILMAGEPGTTVMTGLGLAQDLTPTAPFVMARRQSNGTRFVSLMEPYREQPAIQRFEPGSDRYRVLHRDFEDVIQIAGADELTLLRAQNGAPVRAVACHSNSVTDDRRTWIEFERPTTAQIDWSRDAATVEVNGSVKGGVRAWAPDAVTVKLNGEDVWFSREGEYVAFSPPN